MARCRGCDLTVDELAEYCPRCGAPLPARSRLSTRWMVISAALIVMLVAVLWGSRGRDTAQTQASPAAMSRPFAGSNQKSDNADPENKLHDIMRDKEFLARNPDFPDLTRRMIVANGYDCLRIGILWAKGPSPYGPKLEAFCGPPTGTGIYEAQHYVIYPEQFKVAVCKPNGVFHNGCD